MARSVSGSVPMTLARLRRPSLSTTSIASALNHVVVRQDVATVANNDAATQARLGLAVLIAVKRIETRGLVGLPAAGVPCWC